MDGQAVKIQQTKILGQRPQNTASDLGSKFLGATPSIPLTPKEVLTPAAFLLGWPTLHKYRQDFGANQMRGRVRRCEHTPLRSSVQKILHVPLRLPIVVFVGAAHKHAAAAACSRHAGGDDTPDD